jgi:hypothetical protein
VLFGLGDRLPGAPNREGVNGNFPTGIAWNLRQARAFASLILLLLMLRIKTVALAGRKGGSLMKIALIGGLSGLAMIVGVPAANAQANINPNVYPGNTSGQYGAQAPWEWHGAPGPNKRGAMCVTHTDPMRGYGYQAPCPAPKAAAAAPKRRSAAR